MPPLLLELWREQHTEGHEQTALDFRTKHISMKPIFLFKPEFGDEYSIGPMQKSKLSSYPED